MITKNDTAWTVRLFGRITTPPARRSWFGKSIFLTEEFFKSLQIIQSRAHSVIKINVNRFPAAHPFPNVARVLVKQALIVAATVVASRAVETEVDVVGFHWLKRRLAAGFVVVHQCGIEIIE